MLFAKRFEVGDSHDRYANMGISCRFQKVEEHKDVAILTTDMRANLHESFARSFKMSGGNIKIIALAAALLVKDKEQPIRT